MAELYPQTPYFSAVNFKINTPTLKSETLSGKTRRVGMGHSFYTFGVKYAPLTRYEAGPILGFVAQQYGPMETFQIILPDLSYSKQSDQTTTQVTVASNATAGQDDVAITGVESGKYLLRAGDFFKFSHGTAWAASTVYAVGALRHSGSIDYVCTVAHTSGSTIDLTKWAVDNTYSKVYMCAVTNVPGDSRLYFSGSLVRNIPSGVRILLNAVPFTVILDSDIQQYEVGSGGMTSISLDMKETW
jgi:hypothetical protein